MGLNPGYLLKSFLPKIDLKTLINFVTEKCQGSGILDQIRHLSRSNFESPWHPSVVRQEIQSIVAAEGYNSYEKYIMWKVIKYISKWYYVTKIVLIYCEKKLL